ncbi:hypothetical protein MW290_32080 [Aquincola tertiaricarbonis]|uniref:Uncharacterized protein n=1 Tax=Aquincola tertiaricarbonis TaxID=391953 RepID=A0ABY4SEK7_AQUTE|nr:hypothetical protein MW290_32080 [Aquincola tertiaricarbonis]
MGNTFLLTEHHVELQPVVKHSSEGAASIPGERKVNKELPKNAQALACQLLFSERRTNEG